MSVHNSLSEIIKPENISIHLKPGFSETDKEEELMQEVNLNLLNSIEKLSLDKLKEKNEKEILKFITYYTINLITTKIINKIKKQNTFPSQYYKLIKLIGYIPNIRKLLDFLNTFTLNEKCAFLRKFNLYRLYTKYHNEKIDCSNEVDEKAINRIINVLIASKEQLKEDDEVINFFNKMNLINIDNVKTKFLEYDVYILIEEIYSLLKENENLEKKNICVILYKIFNLHFEEIVSDLECDNISDLNKYYESNKYFYNKYIKKIRLTYLK
jgi:hypothetical protein